MVEGLSLGLDKYVELEVGLEIMCVCRSKKWMVFWELEVSIVLSDGRDFFALFHAGFNL